MFKTGTIDCLEERIEDQYDHAEHVDVMTMILHIYEGFVYEDFEYEEGNCFA